MELKRYELRPIIGEARERPKMKSKRSKTDLFLSAGSFRPSHGRRDLADLEAGAPPRVRVLAGGRPQPRGLRGRRQPQRGPAAVDLPGKSPPEKN